MAPKLYDNHQEIDELAPEELADHLIDRLKSYDKTVDEAAIRKAVDFAKEYHGAQTRKSGQPYYYHPVAVASLLTGLHMDQASIITAVLHDTLEDTEATPEQLRELFGSEVCSLVEGVTKLTKIEFRSHSDRQAENFRKFILATSEDIRVLLIKLADRLHNMRTLHHIKKKEKRERISRETLEIYATLAERIGIQSIKEELQDIAFEALHPDMHDSITQRLAFLREEDEEIVQRVIEKLKLVLKEQHIKSKVSGREKRPYSIWQKMQRKNVSFEQLSDIVGFRVIVADIEQCYQALGYIHSEFHAIPGSFKDYISTPKSNGYQSLHTIVLGPEKQRIEVQIRTEEMHQIAEMGVAAHWAYKQQKDALYEGRQYRWMRELLQIIENSGDAEELLESTRMQMYHGQVFCFTPKGDLIVLPHKATPVDFAFAVHTKIGRNCVGAKVNGRLVPLRTQLKNGDQVEILRSESQHPSPSWESFVVTGKALSEIRKHIRAHKTDEYIRLGEEILTKALAREKAKLSDDMLKPLLEEFKKKKVEEIYYAIGDGSLHHMDVIKAIFPDRYSEKKTSLFSRFSFGKDQQKQDKLDIPIRGLFPGMAMHFAGCCHPLPGEKIVGIVHTGKGVTIHTSNCHELEPFVDQPERWLDVGWDDSSDEDVYVGRLKAVLFNKKGALAEVANSVAKSGANIANIRMMNRASDFFEMLIDIEVHSLTHLQRTISDLRGHDIVYTVERSKEGF